MKAIMETAELQLVLKNCFNPEMLCQYFPACPDVSDLYEIAIDSILSEDEIGLALAQRLDQESERQRARIRSMSPRELRSRFTLEFLEPGRTLGYIIWSLLRDERFIARSLAGEIAAYFSKSSTMPFTQIASKELTEDILQESQLPSDLSPVLSDSNQSVFLDTAALKLQTGMHDTETLEAPALQDFREKTTSSSPTQQRLGEGIKDMNSTQTGGETNKTYADIENLIAALDIETKETKSSFSPSEKTPEKSKFGSEETASKTQSSPYLMRGQKETIASALSPIKRSQTVPPLKPSRKPSTTKEELVLFKEVEIALTSLKRACERLFNEPIELVADPNIIDQDKIVVVGKQCGVKLLYGPQHVIRPAVSAIEKETTSVVLANSLQAALSRIYEEPVELIPDPELLQHGIVPFAGKKLGIKVMENERISVTLPNWAESMLSEEKSILIPGQPVDFTPLLQRIETLEKRIALLEPLSEPQPKIEEPVAEPFGEPKAIAPEVLDPILKTHARDIRIPEVEDSFAKNPLNFPTEIAVTSVESTEVFTIAEEKKPTGEFTPVEIMKTGEFEVPPALPAESADLDAIDFTDSNQYKKSSEIIGSSLETDLAEITSTEFPPQTMAGDTVPSTKAGTFTDTLDLQKTGNQENPASSGETAEMDLNLDDLDLDELTKDLPTLETEDISGAEINLGDLNLDKLSEDLLDNSIAETSGSGDLLSSTGISALASEETNLEELNLDILSELGKVDEVGTEQNKVFQGETILLLGGEEKYKEEYRRVVEELGGKAEWHPRLNEFPKEEIARFVNQADLILTISSGAVTDPGILYASEYAKSSRKQLFQYHSSRPSGVQKQLIKLAKEGKV